MNWDWLKRNNAREAEGGWIVTNSLHRIIINGMEKLLKPVTEQERRVRYDHEKV